MSKRKDVTAPALPIPDVTAPALPIPDVTAPALPVPQSLVASLTDAAMQSVTDFGAADHSNGTARDRIIMVLGDEFLKGRDGQTAENTAAIRAGLLAGVMQTTKSVGYVRIEGDARALRLARLTEAATISVSPEYAMQNEPKDLKKTDWALWLVSHAGHRDTRLHDQPLSMRHVITNKVNVYYARLWKKADKMETGPRLQSDWRAQIVWEMTARIETLAKQIKNAKKVTAVERPKAAELLNLITAVLESAK